MLRRPLASPLSPDPVQKSKVSSPHRTELPSSTDQSKGASPNSLPSLRTQLIIAIIRYYEAMCRIATGDDLRCSANVTVSYI